MIATHPELRRRGIGRALLITALHRLQTVGGEVVSLFTESNNLSAQRLYIALGFQHHRQARIYTRILPPTEATATVIGTAL